MRKKLSLDAIFNKKKVIVTTKLKLETEKGYQILTYSGIYMNKDDDFVYLGAEGQPTPDTVIHINEIHSIQLSVDNSEHMEENVNKNALN